MTYRPKPDSYPNADVLEGNAGELDLYDMTADGGHSLVLSRGYSGRRAKPESVPKIICWHSKRKLLDYESVYIKTVNDRFRTLIEELEPAIHQFESVAFVSRDGAPLATRWFWQVCNRLNTVHSERTNWVLDGIGWRVVPKSQRTEEPRLVFDIRKIGDACFWHDKHLISGTYVSDDAKSRIELSKITGVHFKHYDQA